MLAERLDFLGGIIRNSWETPRYNGFDDSGEESVLRSQVVEEKKN